MPKSPTHPATTATRADPALVAEPSKKRIKDRRCVATGDALEPGAPALRFVLDPQGYLVLDLKGSLPGRGSWITPGRKALLQAIKCGGFARGFKSQPQLPDGQTEDAFADTVAHALQTSALQKLGLARRSGHLIIGKDAARKAAPQAIAYLTPQDASEPEVMKVARFLEKAVGTPHLFLPATRAEIAPAVGQDGVHLVLLRGGTGPSALAAARLWGQFISS
ncbi:MAG: DUF448 domain-containing protein [Pseudomonadota bacterium]